jgi:spore germination protein YaaH
LANKAIDLQIGWTLEAKNVSIHYVPPDTQFVTKTMTDIYDAASFDVNNSIVSDVGTSEKAIRIVEDTVAFGFSGSGGVLQKCLVVLDR